MVLQMLKATIPLRLEKCRPYGTSVEDLKLVYELTPRRVSRTRAGTGSTLWVDQHTWLQNIIPMASPAPAGQEGLREADQRPSGASPTFRDRRITPSPQHPAGYLKLPWPLCLPCRLPEEEHPTPRTTVANCIRTPPYAVSILNHGSEQGTKANDFAIPTSKLDDGQDATY